MVYPSQSTNDFVNFPHSAYRWILLDGVKYTNDNLFAVYQHNNNKVWCVLRKLEHEKQVNIHIFFEDDIPKSVDTDMNCLIDLLKKSVSNTNKFVTKSQKIGGVSDAYKISP